jgi:two-component sensor histidine kinase
MEREEAKERIRTLLKEKELLLREVHHRIKNNMSTVGSLLGMQSDLAANEESRNCLLAAKGRIDSMLLLYQKLYQSEDFSNVETRAYFSSLMDEIVANNIKGTAVSTVYDFDDFELDAKSAHYVGMIVNELATNCLKHAFADTANPTIEFSIKKKGETAFFAVSDNGSGLGNGTGRRSAGGFGMQLVETLIEQLNGSLTVESGRGMTVAFSVPL